MEPKVVKYSVRLIESDSTIRKLILEALQEDVEQTFRKALPNITKNIQELINKTIKNTPEYQSLLNGQLKFEFGLYDSQNQADKIVDTWSNNINIDMKPIKINNAGLSGGFSLGMIASNLQDVLSLAEASMIDTDRGYSLPWLQWLLKDGGKVLVKDYKVVLGPNPYSRTGYAIMRSDSSSNWRVPPEFAGTITNNWVTRAIDSLSDEINSIIIQQIERAIV
jgi:hypothetical protein